MATDMVRYRTDPEYRRKVLDGMKRRYHSNENVRQKHIENANNYKEHNKHKVNNYQFIYKRINGIVKGSNEYDSTRFYKLVSNGNIRYVDKEKHRSWQKESRDKRRYECIYYYSKGIMQCACCPENVYEFLTIDHVNNDGAEHRRLIRGNLYIWLVKNGFPEGFQVLCMNCNFAKGQYGRCPHEYLRGDKIN